MQQITRSVTSKGQVTIPKRIREQLGLDATDKVTFVVDDEGHVELRPARFQWKDLRGIVAPLPGQDPVDFEEAFEEAMQQRGEELMSGKHS